MVCGGITKDGMSKRKVDPCVVCSLRVKANSVGHGKQCSLVQSCVQERGWSRFKKGIRF